MKRWASGATPTTGRRADTASDTMVLEILGADDHLSLAEHFRERARTCGTVVDEARDHALVLGELGHPVGDVIWCPPRGGNEPSRAPGLRQALGKFQQPLPFNRAIAERPGIAADEQPGKLRMTIGVRSAALWRHVPARRDRWRKVSASPYAAGFPRRGRRTRSPS